MTTSRIVADTPVTARRDRPPPGVKLPIHHARTPWSRFRGLLGYRDPPPFALSLEPCRSIHTFGMHFPLDLHWIDASGRTIRVDRDVRSCRVRRCRSARSVIEVPSGDPARRASAVARPPTSL
jgi:uncharacterized protein